MVTYPNGPYGITVFDLNGREIFSTNVIGFEFFACDPRVIRWTLPMAVSILRCCHMTEST